MNDCSTHDYSGAVNRMHEAWVESTSSKRGEGKKYVLSTCFLSRKIVVNNAITFSALGTSNLVPLEVWEGKYQEN